MTLPQVLTPECLRSCGSLVHEIWCSWVWCIFSWKLFPQWKGWRDQTSLPHKSRNIGCGRKATGRQRGDEVMSTTVDVSGVPSLHTSEATATPTLFLFVFRKICSSCQTWSRKLSYVYLSPGGMETEMLGKQLENTNCSLLVGDWSKKKVLPLIRSMSFPSDIS